VVLLGRCTVNGIKKAWMSNTNLAPFKVYYCLNMEKESEIKRV
jgi:hypothetical protein